MVEALATMVLTGLILAGLAATISLMAAAGERAAARAERAEATALLIAALRRDVAAAVRARWGRDGDFVFEGTADRLTFAQDGAQGHGTLVVLQAVIDPAGTQLLRAEGPLHPAARGMDDVALGPAVEVAAVRGRIDFAYASAGDGGAELVTSVWPPSRTMPDTVLVRLGEATFADRITLAVDAEAGCAATAEAFCSRRPPVDDE